MIIPVRCFSCAEVLADKWNAYVRECKKLEETEETDITPEERERSKSMKNMDTKKRGEILDKLGLTRICCRRMMLGNVDMLEII